jgi:hypothetical protein
MRTGRFTHIVAAVALVVGVATLQSGVILGGAAAAGASEPAHGSNIHGSYNCTSGNIPPGTYKSMTISGVCFMSDGNVVVKGNLTVKPGALLDNGTPGDPASSTKSPPVVAANLYVGGNVKVGKGAVLVLGCSPNSACGGAQPPKTPPPGPGISSAQIRGNLTANQALGVVVHSSSIGGNFTDIGGGGGTMGGVATGGCFAAAPPAPWSEDTGSLAGNPVYTDVEDASIGGNYTIAGVSSCWLGSLRNQIRGNATFIGNQMGDPDAMEIGNNLVGRNLTCFNNDPAPQFGDGASSDLVAGRASGQCAFDVVLPNPAPEAVAGNGGTGVGIQQHFAVSTRHLKTYFGTHTEGDTPVLSLPPVTTDAGNTISAAIFNFTLASKGGGLVGTGTYTGGPPGQSPGETLLATTFPNETESFTAYDTCDKCGFAGQNGSVSLRAYGTTNRHGFTSGTFLITSNGTVLPDTTTPVPGLATLVGYGSFWGSGATVHVIEHLGFG